MADTLGDYYRHAGIPKPEPRKRVKARKGREDAKDLKVFRDKVWRRETTLANGGGMTIDIARCQHCRWLVVRRESYQTGEVHHRIGRGNKATRYDPANGVLLCNHLVNDCHGKAQRHEITV